MTVTLAGNKPGSTAYGIVAVFPKNAAVKADNKYYIDDATVSPKSTTSDGLTSIPLNTWKTVSCEVSLEPGQRIAFGSDGTTNYYLDDIKVELVSYD